MNKKMFSILSMVLVVVMCFSFGVMAESVIQEIKAYLNPGITVKLDGQTQTMHNAAGEKVYPISYQGTTYLPIRAVSNMLDINVDWDGQTSTVLLGKTGMAKDFINDLTPYSTVGHYDVCQTSDGFSQTVAGKAYDRWIYMFSNAAGYYDLGGKYNKLTFQVYSEIDTVIKAYGDNDEVIGTYTVKANALPLEYIVDVTNVTQLTLAGNTFGSFTGNGPVYIINATIE